MPVAGDCALVGVFLQCSSCAVYPLLGEDRGLVTWHAGYRDKEEGRAANKSTHCKFGYFLSISQHAVSAISPKIQLLQYYNHEYLNKHIYSTRKRFEECVREEQL